MNQLKQSDKGTLRLYARVLCTRTLSRNATHHALLVEPFASFVVYHEILEAIPMIRIDVSGRKLD